MATTQANDIPWMDPTFQAGLVSVILPTFNRGHLIRNALTSLWRQTYRPLEVLVVDDGSTDDTESVVNDWASQHVGEGLDVRYLPDSNRGAPAARNRGLKHSRGEFIQFLDSDDLILPMKLEWQVEALRRDPSAQYAWSDRRRGHVDTFWELYEELAQAQKGLPPPAPTRVVGAAKKRLPNNGGHGIYRRSACVRLGPWDESLARHQDWEFNVRLIASDITALYVAGVQHIGGDHSGPRVFDLSTNTTQNYQRFVTGCEAACEVAESRLKGDSVGAQAARYKISLLYMYAALAALERIDRTTFDAAMVGFWRNATERTVRLKASALSLAVSVLGLPVARTLNRQYRRFT